MNISFWGRPILNGYVSFRQGTVVVIRSYYFRAGTPQQVPGRNEIKWIDINNNKPQAINDKPHSRLSKSPDTFSMKYMSTWKSTIQP